MSSFAALVGYCSWSDKGEIKEREGRATGRGAELSEAVKMLGGLGKGTASVIHVHIRTRHLRLPAGVACHSR